MRQEMMNHHRPLLKRFAAVALMTALGVATPTPAWAVLSPNEVHTPQAIARAAFPSVVMLVLHAADPTGHDQVSQGSGFYVGEGLVATNYHVVSGMTEGWARVVGEESKLTIEGVVAFDAERDLAILRVAEGGGPALPLGSIDNLTVADKVYAVGNPQGLEGTFSEGLISSIRRKGGQSMLQISAPISQGSSGGPVFDDHGRVVGVAVGMMKEGQNLNFAIPIDDVQRLLADVGRAVPLTTLRDGEATLRAAQPGIPNTVPPVAAPPTALPGKPEKDGRTPIDCGTFTCRLPKGWSVERNDSLAAAFSAARRRGGFALLTVFFKDQPVVNLDDEAGMAIAKLGNKYLRHRMIALGGERAYLIMYRAASSEGPVFASDVSVMHAGVTYTISLWSDANAHDIRAIGDEFDALARSWTWR